MIILFKCFYAGLDSNGGKYGELNERIKLCCERRLEVKKRHKSLFFLQEPALHRCLMGTRLWFLQDWKVGAAKACSVIIWAKQACVHMHEKTNMTTTVHYLLDEVISKQLVNWNVAASGGRSCTMWDKKGCLSSLLWNPVSSSQPHGSLSHSVSAPTSCCSEGGF